MKKDMNVKEAFKVPVAMVAVGFLAVQFDRCLSNLFPYCLIPINREREMAKSRRGR